MQSNKDKNLIVELSFVFALKIIKYVELLEQGCKYVIERQLIRSGTSIGANVREAQNAESRADFIHKLKVALKRQMKQNTGFYFVKNLKDTKRMMNYYKIALQL